MYNFVDAPFYSEVGGGIPQPLIVRNNIAAQDLAASPGYSLLSSATLDSSSSNNLSTDSGGTATLASPGGFALDNMDVNGSIQFVDRANRDLHVQFTSVVRNNAADLRSIFTQDIDAQLGSQAPSPGTSAPTSRTGRRRCRCCRSTAFRATGRWIWWADGSEVDNLGFHVYRSFSPDGPWTRLTSSLIPGLGFSAMGAATHGVTAACRTVLATSTVWRMSTRSPCRPSMAPSPPYPA